MQISSMNSSGWLDITMRLDGIDASAIMKDLAIPAKTSIWLEGITTIMEASSELRAQAANASSVTIRVSGVEIS